MNGCGASADQSAPASIQAGLEGASRESKQRIKSKLQMSQVHSKPFSALRQLVTKRLRVHARCFRLPVFVSILGTSFGTKDYARFSGSHETLKKGFNSRRLHHFRGHFLNVLTLWMGDFPKQPNSRSEDVETARDLQQRMAKILTS